ncbi:glycosyltransferase family 39 protein [Cupriavidus necator]|uniref:Putative 4-amino-4-deoxy-L-arabinose transferase and related glycosyltransferases of PMT family n=1 Tax=Cupriavidus pinatubonensis (strain JMP 134 / LMG 1197) TaxID=264198 RepID=Q46VG8_CUPPJ|nr:glycosyltransferase family 39 protein [Cupriavidus necator]
MEDFSALSGRGNAAQVGTALPTTVQKWPLLANKLAQQQSAASIFVIALLAHMILWTLLPSLLLKNASLDIIEALAWGHEWQLGYEKDPPLWPWVTEALTVWPGKNLWACYLAAQVCIGTVFVSVWQLGCRIASRREALLGALLLEGIYYFNFPTPEFNDIVLQMPFAALFGWLLHRALTDNRLRDWCLAGFVAGLGLWARYSMGAYLIPMAIFVLLHPVARRRLAEAGPWVLVATALLTFLPHMAWIVDSGFISIEYVARRAPEATNGLHYVARLSSFIGAQLAALIPMLLLALMLWRWKNPNPQSPSDSREFDRAYLAALAFGPIVFSVILSAMTQRPPRVMWAAPLLCYVGLFIATSIRPVLTAQRLRTFGRAWIAVLLLPALLFTLEQVARPYVMGKENRSHFPGRSLAAEVTDRWHAETGTPMKYVIGDTWYAGNAAFYSDDRPSALFVHGGYRFNPWVTPEKLKKEGAVLVWDAASEGADIPPIIAGQFPGAALQPDVSVRGPASVHQVGIAFLLPSKTATPDHGERLATSR